MWVFRLYSKYNVHMRISDKSDRHSVLIDVVQVNACNKECASWQKKINGNNGNASHVSWTAVSGWHHNYHHQTTRWHLSQIWDSWDHIRHTPGTRRVGFCCLLLGFLGCLAKLQCTLHARSWFLFDPYIALTLCAILYSWMVIISDLNALTLICHSFNSRLPEWIMVFKEIILTLLHSLPEVLLP